MDISYKRKKKTEYMSYNIKNYIQRAATDANNVLQKEIHDQLWGYCFYRIKYICIVIRNKMNVNFI